MQLNEFKIGWLRKRVRIACTLMAGDVPTLQQELEAFKADLHGSLDHHGAKCSRIERYGIQQGQPSGDDRVPAG
jgi:hypothetical protein